MNVDRVIDTVVAVCFTIAAVGLARALRDPDKRSRNNKISLWLFSLLALWEWVRVIFDV